MPLQLRGITDRVAGQRHVLLDDRPFFVGSGEENDLMLAGKGVARRHAVVVAGLAGPLLCSLTGRSGPRVNGKRVQSAILRLGDELAVGEHVFRVEDGAAPHEPERPQPATPEAIRIADGQDGVQAVLHVIAGELVGQSYPLVGGATTQLGRGPECDIVFQSQRVSRIHARVTATADGFRLSDAGSTNGTRVNGRLVSEQLLSFGDEIVLGGQTLRLEAAGIDHAATPEVASPVEGVLCPGRCGRIYPFGLEHCPLDGALLAGGRSVIR